MHGSRVVTKVAPLRVDLSSFSIAILSACFEDSSPLKAFANMIPSFAITAPTLGNEVHFDCSSIAIFIKSTFDNFCSILIIVFVFFKDINIKLKTRMLI